jgi:competence protein ComEC
MRAPAALAAIPFLAGVAGAFILWPTLSARVPLLASGAAALALLAAAACAADDDTPCACLSVVSGCLLAGVALGCIAADAAYDPPLLRWYAAHGTSDPVTLEGVLREDAAATAFGASVVLDVDRVASQPTAGGIRLSIIGSFSAAAAAEWRSGRRLRLPAILRRPSLYRNPGVPDEAAALARRGISLVGSAKSAALVERIADGSRLQEAAAGARAWARRRLAAIEPLSVRSAAIATAILIGDRHRLSNDDERRLQHAGTYHVIAISGGNIAIVTLVLMLLGRLLFLTQATAAAVMIAALLFYGQMTGPAASVERAVTAAVIFLAARLADHRGPPLNALGVAALFIGAASPVAILDPGFVLSFGATLGILLGTPHLVARPRRSAGNMWVRSGLALRRAAAALLAATACAEIMLAPVAASLFGRVTFAGFLLNFAAIPLMTVVQLAGTAVLVLPRVWPPMVGAATWTAHLAAYGLVESARLVELVPWLSLAVHPPSWQILALYYAAAMALLSARFRRIGLAAVAALAALIVAGPHALARHSIPPSRYPLRMVVLDVGQGDATVVSLPGSHALLVDAGGVAAYSSPPDDGAMPGFDVGERVVVPALRALDVSRLEALVVTHGDPDHILGAPGVLRALVVGSVWEGVPVPRHSGLQMLRTIAGDAGATWRTVQAGDVERFGDVELRVLHPPPPAWERQRVRNEDSIVLEFRLGDVSVVLAGDIGQEGERAILSRLDAGRLTVLKAGHHGSATSSTPEMLAALDPAAVIFSAGQHNRFGHPHPAVVARFEAMGAAVFRTDRDGAVFIETDGRTVSMRGWTGRSLQLAERTSAVARTTARRHDGTKER